MERIGERLIWYYLPGTTVEIPLGGVNIITIFNTLVVMLLIYGFCRIGIRRLAMTPGRGQMAVELFAGAFDGLVTSSLEMPTQKENRRYFPLITTLMAFLLLGNFMSFIPTHYFEEPTADINTTLGLGIMGMAIAVASAVAYKGSWGYIEELLGPLWNPDEGGAGAQIAGKLSALFFFPLNVIGELAKIVSISFRIFGNILGGGIIIIVIMELTQQFSPLSVGVDLFFIFFVGTVQAFVFTMLTLTYIAVAVK